MDGERALSYATLIACLKQIESTSLVYRNEPPSHESHGALKQSLVEGYLVIAAQTRSDPIVDPALSRIMSVCRSIIHALEFSVMEGVLAAPSRRMAIESCTELSRLISDLMPYLMENDCQ